MKYVGLRAAREDDDDYATYSSIAEIPNTTVQQRGLADRDGDVAARCIVKVRLSIVLVPVG